jgi:DNA-binding CsgD family transcriptional regulator
MPGDVISIIEAAYRVELGADEWLGGVLQSAQPSLLGGAGAFAYEYDASDPNRMQVTRVAMGGGLPPALTPDALARVVETADADYVRATWRSVPCGLASGTPGVEHQPGWVQLQAIGIADILAVNGIDPAGKGVWLGHLLTKRPRLDPRKREKWSRVAAHLATGLRLRRRLEAVQGGRPDLVSGADAVVSPSGKVEHAEGDAAEKEARAALRDAVIAVDRARGPLRRRAPDEAIAAWKGLVDARWSLVDQFESDGRRYLVARRNEPGVVALDVLSARERQIVSYVSFGHSNKLIAYELGISASTVRVLVARAAAKLGVRSRGELASLAARELELGKAPTT